MFQWFNLSSSSCLFKWQKSQNGNFAHVDHENQLTSISSRFNYEHSFEKTFAKQHSIIVSLYEID